MPEKNFPLPRDTVLAELEAEASSYLTNSLSSNTRRAYRADWEDFQMWCKRRRFKPLPATERAVALYITELVRALKVSSIKKEIINVILIF